MRPHPRRLVRRHRRLVAAVLAGTATLIVLSGLRHDPDTSSVAAALDPSIPRTGEASVPVTLASSALAAVLHSGDVIDLVSVADPAAPDLVARAARVLTVPAPGSMLSSSTSGVILVAVPAADALAVTAAASQEALTFVIPAPPPKT